MTLETILRTVLHAVAWSALVAFCGVVAGVGIHWILRLLCHALAETGRRCGKWAAVTLASLALVCGVVAQKANTNDAPSGVSSPAPMMSAARGAPETYLQDPTNAPETFPPRLAAQRPANVEDVEEWKLRGAYDDAIRIPAMGWDFQTPDGFVEGMTVFSRGEFRPDIGHLYFPRPFTNNLSFLPQSRWELLPNGGESKLWYAATPSNSLLVTWGNGLLDRNPLTPTNFQAEFFPNGGAIAFNPPSPLDAREPYFASFVCEGGSPSESEGDVQIEGTFTENTTHAVISQDKSLRAVDRPCIFPRTSREDFVVRRGQK